uniref:BURP domain-containing protein n=1 Tax=Kalanchoe fedtschenkoi TaxID=63787 RepID=A0A7N0TCQ5_KALFE
MAFHIHAALAALCVAFAASQAHLPGEIYWTSKLPDVTVPRAISDALASVKAGKAEEILPEEPGKRLLFYGYYDEVLDTNKNEVVVNPPSSHFFLEKDLVPGKQMEMDFTRPENIGYVFIPRQVADSIQFSSDQLSVILGQLSIDPESPKAQLMKDTLKYCDFPAGEGEVKTCATSLEAMIDFSTQRSV